MTTALISDVHGNYPALVAVFREIHRLKCQRVISFGDIAGYYCQINECIELCRDNQVVNIRGNHDDYLLSGARCPRSTTANICLDYQREIIRDDNYRWLAGSVPMLREDQKWFVHGGWNDYLDEYVTKFDFGALPDPGVSLYGSGHSHIQSTQCQDGVTYVNPGSVGQPRDSDMRAAFAILDASGRVSLHRVEYDIDGIATAMRHAGFEARYYTGLYSGTRIQSFTRGA